MGAAGMPLREVDKGAMVKTGLRCGRAAQAE